MEKGIIIRIVQLRLPTFSCTAKPQDKAEALETFTFVAKMFSRLTVEKFHFLRLKVKYLARITANG